METVLIITCVAFVGLMLGSFSSALAYRIPRGIPWIKASNNVPARSACTACGHTLSFMDLVPVLSWLAQRGRCRYCKNLISIRYPLTEIAIMLACIVTYWVYELSPASLFMIAALPFLAALFLIDLETLTLPNKLVAKVAILGSGLLVTEIFYTGDISAKAAFYEYGLGALIYGWLAWLMGAVMTRILGQSALGFGDVKFFAAAGLWLGVSNLGWYFALSGLLGVALAVIWKIFKGDQVFPFGPALIVALYLLFILDGSLLP